MFTGILEEVGRVKSLERPLPEGGARLAIRAGKVLDNAKLGDSVAVNGACLTVVALGDASLSVDLAPETLRRTNLGSLEAGRGSTWNVP